MSYARSRRNGLAWEHLAGDYVSESLCLQRTEAVSSLAAAELVAALDAHPEVSVGRNSSVEGVWVARSGAPVVVECSGSRRRSSSPGCVRSCTMRKLLGAATAVAMVCRTEVVPAPGYVIVTTALPAVGSSAAGWLKALVWLSRSGQLGPVEFHLLDADSGEADLWDEARLALRYGI